ncbi:MAG: HAD family hydrolase [Erysipelotrichaceae bacterium]|nr:HAD family hydrolase [Erysipelotrichaceae bacterium]
MLKAVFFDLDSTLLPMNEDLFAKEYFSLLADKASNYGHKKDDFVKTIWGGTKKMVTNDGSMTNEQAFWNFYTSVYGEDKIKDKVVFDAFYLDEFKGVKKHCYDNPYLEDLFKYLKTTNLKIILATNPLFPVEAVLTRMAFVGLKKEDFDYITNYSNSSFCKPNPNYYQELLNKLGLKPEEVIMIGNSLEEDGIASFKVGIKPYVLENNSYPEKEGITYIKFENIKDVIKKNLEG